MRLSCRRPRRRCIFYHLDSDGHGQTGIAACYLLRSTMVQLSKSTNAPARTRKTIGLAISSSCVPRQGPCFWRIARSLRIDELARQVRTNREPLVDFTALDGVRHAIWRVDADLVPQFVEAFTSVEALYIADGHHRAASAARARDEVHDRRGTVFSRGGVSLGSGEDSSVNRVVKDLNGRRRVSR